ncbi:hypothetical protein BGZ65_008564 [Modicella reniformis]|uniref:Extracellular membrane protein CFEM domain-containing protein n=1 Tax=Modicella reniformis TaxID=1440133 RepID=A0A9P6SPV9_9FUNG|nr:hypothetical protein BGZ65_008564 [Modicella reniformis]
MKFIAFAASAIATIASLVSAQSDPVACTLCLQKALQALPACANIQPSAGLVSSQYATCLCSSLSGSWIDSCSGAAQCGSGVSTFKALYSASIQAAGLSCSGQASFTAA